jgi:hypothetical protein
LMHLNDTLVENNLKLCGCILLVTDVNLRL